jgi:hypothetical protein
MGLVGKSYLELLLRRGIFRLVAEVMCCRREVGDLEEASTPAKLDQVGGPKSETQDRFWAVKEEARLCSVQTSVIKEG